MRRVSLLAVPVLVASIAYGGDVLVAGPPMIGLGDSIGEGVQSGEATWRTQPNTYLAVIARQMNVPLPLPLIDGGLFTSVFSTDGRNRLSALPGRNLAVSGADVGSLLREQADGVVDSETDLVLWPRRGSQIEIAERLGAAFVVCWIGNNDVLGAALAFDQLDASQLTPVAQFKADFEEIAQRLTAGGTAKVIVGNIPDVTRIAFLFAPADLVRLLGSDFGLPQGSYTSLVAAILLKTGLADATLLTDPDWVLDAREVQTIQERTAAFNDIIRETAAARGIALVDTHAVFEAVGKNPPVVLGVPVTTRFLGGLFSLDAVHPSNLAHAVIANAFITQANQQLGMAIPPLTSAQVATAFLADPFVDRDGDGRVPGRPGEGLLETIMPGLGFSGDRNEAQPGASRAGVDPTLAAPLMREYRRATGQADDAWWDRQDVVEALRHALGLPRQARR